MFTKNINAVLEELKEIASNISEKETEEFENAVLKADRIFVAGCGRSLLMIRSFAMRLMQMGFTAYVVGENVTPGIREGDLLIIASGSGETGTLKVIAKNAEKAGAKITLITTNPDSSIAGMSDCVVTVRTNTPKLGSNIGIKPSVQPGASSFEQSVLLICDAVIIDLGSSKDIGELNSGLMQLHANLE